MEYEFASNRIQYVAIFGSIILLLFIFELIRKKKLKEKYSLLWFFVALLFLLFSFWREGLEVLSELVGIQYPPATLFLIFLLGYLLIMVHYSIVISRISDIVKDLTQEVGLLKQELSKLKGTGGRKPGDKKR
jgi:hypothetical protein